MGVICIAAALVLGILGLFSAKYRPLAKEAFDCAFRTITLRPCQTGFDRKIKMKLTGGLLKVSPRASRIVYKNFQLLANIFVGLMILSTVAFAVGVYNFAEYGNCNGPESTGFCIFDPSGTGAHGFSRLGDESALVLPANFEGIVFGNPDAKVTIIELGALTCPYTKKQEPILQRLMHEYKDADVQFILKLYSIEAHPFSAEASLAIDCATEQGKYEIFREQAFNYQHEVREEGLPRLKLLAQSYGLNMQAYNECISKDATEKLAALKTEAESIGLYGTPTFFINGTAFVGHIDYETLKEAIEKELKK